MIEEAPELPLDGGGRTIVLRRGDERGEKFSPTSKARWFIQHHGRIRRFMSLVACCGAFTVRRRPFSRRRTRDGALGLAGRLAVPTLSGIIATPRHGTWSGAAG